jgi:hypothetical protein
MILEHVQQYKTNKYSQTILSSISEEAQPLCDIDFEIINDERNVHPEACDFSFNNVRLLPPSVSNHDNARNTDQLYH